MDIMKDTKTIHLRMTMDDLKYMAKLRDEYNLTSFADVQKILIQNYKLAINRCRE